MKDDASLREFMSRLDVGVYIWSKDRKISFWNSAAERLSGYAAEEMLGSRCSDNRLRHVTPDGVNLCLNGCPMAASMHDGMVREADVYMHHRDGSRQPIAVWSSPLHDDSGAITGAIEIFSDRRNRSDLLSELEILRHEVLSDPLTKLGNRRYLDIVAASRFEAMEKGYGGFGLFMVDIDHFKQVNDTYGHTIGDEVLKMVSSTLTSAIRPLDAAVRWGGEEFILLCANVPEGKLAELAERIRFVVAESWLSTKAFGNIAVTVSVGATRAIAGETLASVIARADTALYRAKETGRNRCLVEL
jgi:diguanylate cyclase (GGDEF)-like protein/PAS domain S-box-containing protein